MRAAGCGGVAAPSASGDGVAAGQLGVVVPYRTEATRSLQGRAGVGGVLWVRTHRSKHRIDFVYRLTHPEDPGSPRNCQTPQTARRRRSFAGADPAKS